MKKIKIRLLIAITCVIWAAVIYYIPAPLFLPKAAVGEAGDTQKEAIKPPPAPTMYYSIVIDSLELSHGRIKRNQNLSEILQDFNVSHQDLYTLSHRSKKVYDVRKLKTGTKYTVLHQNDSLQTATHFVFEPSPREYVIYYLGDSVYAQGYQKEIAVRERAVAAEVVSSVYESILDQGASPVLANQLVDVFAWQVDFDRIAKGDQFKIIFEEEVVDDEVIGIKSIKGAFFEHRGETSYAIAYDMGSKTDYFDPEGKSLRKAFLKYPLKYFDRISSRYSLRRFHPVQKRYKPHLGTDYAARPGTPIRTVGDGVVIAAGYHSGNGNYVKIKHNSNYTTQYLHMSKIAKGIKRNTKVSQGQTIGYVGSTGLATGPHLCYRFWKNGRQVDALKVDLPSSAGINEDQMHDFAIVSASLKSRLDSLPVTQTVKRLAEFSK